MFLSLLNGDFSKIYLRHKIKDPCTDHSGRGSRDVGYEKDAPLL